MNKQQNIKKLSFGAIFIAMNIIFSRLLYINIVTFRFSFSPVPLHLSGYILGPLWGFVVGAVADLIGVMLNPQGTTHLGITLVNALQGAIPGLIVLINKKKINIKSIVISNLLTTIICSLVLMTIFLAQLQGKGFNTLFEVRALKSTIVGVVYIIIELLLLPILQNMKNYLPEDIKVLS